MEVAEGARQFRVEGSAYDRFMGRYSGPLATSFADFAQVEEGQRVLDVGCGPGALTSELVARVGAAAVTAVDPSPPFVEACTHRLRGVDVRVGRAEDLPLGTASFDRVLAQLVLHFVTDPAAAALEFRRMLGPGGCAAACVWDFDRGMQMLRLFWDAALTVRVDAPDEARTLRFGRPGEIATVLADGGFVRVEETELEVASSYTDFDELWSGFLEGVGPAGTYCLSLDEGDREAVRDELYARLGNPTGAFTLQAVARAARGWVPDGPLPPPRSPAR